MLSPNLGRFATITPILISGTLTTLGDLLAQKGVEKKSHWDARRTIRMAFYGFCIAGPAVLVWFKSLEIIIPPTHPKLLRTVETMLVDQLVFCPIFTAVFFVYNGYLEGGSWEAIKHKFKFAYIPTMIANYKIWPVVQLINFYLVPLPYRVPFVNVVALGWNAYVSVLNARHSLHDRSAIK